MTTTPTHTSPRTPPRINPRIRERRIEVQREAGRKRLRVLLVVSSVLSAIGLAFLVVTSPVLDVDHIPVDGRATCESYAGARRGRGAHATITFSSSIPARSRDGSNRSRGSSTRRCSVTFPAR